MAFLGFNPELPSRPFRAASPSDLPAFLSRIAQLDREFVIYDDGWRGWTYSYSEIEQMAKALAARFVSNGIGKGDAVLIWSESRPGWIAALWACLIEGVVLVPVEQQSSPSLLHRIEQQVEPLVILLGDLVPRFQEPYRLPVWSLRDIEADLNRPALDPVPLSVDDVAEIVFTSGTTGEPKGVVMTHRNLAASLRPIEDQLAPYRRYLQFLAPLRVLNLLPLSHLFGQTIALFLVPLIPASVVFLSSTSPEEIARQIRTRRMCALVSVPKVLEVMRDFVLHRFPETKDAKKAVGSLLVRLWRHRAVHRLFGWRFCCFVVGGAPLSPELEQFWSNLGFVVAQGYGLTETAPIVSFNHPFHVQKGTAGKPIAGIEIKVADDGEVLVRGDNVTPGYFHRATETAAVFQDGWFHTGDIGELGPQGDLVIRGRKKDLIVTPEGLKVFPEDVEGILDCIDGVRESAVIDKDGVHAVLVLEPGFQGEEILRQANRQLEPHQRIRSFTPWGQAELPRTTTTQKLRRAAIAEALRTGKRESGKHTLTIADLVQKYAPGRIITSDTTLEELGLSSLDRVELLMDLEEKLDTSVDESMFSSASTVADLTSPPAAAKPTPQPTYNRLWIAKLIRRLLLPTIVLPLTKSFAHLKISGRENLNGIEGPVIFVANHQSHFDTPTILASLPGRWRYRLAPAMWKEYFDAHFFPERHTIGERWSKSILYRLATVLFNAFPIPQAETGTHQSLRYIGELIEQGWSILMFPEGERTTTGQIKAFFPGAAIVASQMGVPAVPIRLVGLDRILHRDAVWPRRGPAEVRIGSPIFLKGDDYRALTRQLEDAVRSL